MKKTVKLLVLLLSLALIFGAIAIIANADDEEAIVYASLTEEDKAAIASGEWTLEENKLIEESIDVAADLTVDLNGYAIKSVTEKAFVFSSSSTLNIKGEGLINLVGAENSAGANHTNGRLHFLHCTRLRGGGLSTK